MSGQHRPIRALPVTRNRARGERSGVLLIKPEGPWWFEVGRGQGSSNNKTPRQGIKKQIEGQAYGKHNMRDGEEQATGRGLPEISFIIGLKQVEDFPQKPLLSFTNLQINNLLSQRMHCIL